MPTCDITIDSFQAEDGNLLVSEKYIQLMQDSLGDDSLYIRTKGTILELFESLQLDETQKAEIIANHMVQFGVNLSSSSQQIALAWAKEEKEASYTLAKLKADTEVSLAQLEKVKSDICLTDKQTLLACAQTTAASSASVRDNGTVATYGADGCSVTALNNNGLKYQQTLQVEAATYQIAADAFRKSGVVQIGVDAGDGVKKGLSGDANGYTHQQEINAERLRIAYEDSKLNHAVNGASAMIGQMLASEVDADPEIIQYWKDGMSGLLTKHSTTSAL